MKIGKRSLSSPREEELIIRMPVYGGHISFVNSSSCHERRCLLKCPQPLLQDSKGV